MNALEAVFDFFTRYGYYFVLVGSTVENIPVLGLFMPGEIIVVAAAVFAALDRGFTLSGVILVASVGGIAGSAIGYLLGARGGRPLIEALARRLGVEVAKIDAADRYFATHGNKTVFLGRYVAGVKAFVPALAGAAHMDFGRFIGYSALGIISWTVLASLLGYFFGTYWTAVLAILRAVGWLVVAVGVLLVLYFRFVRKPHRGNQD